MTGNNTSEMKSVKSGIKIKMERKEEDDDCSATIPSSWKKFGEVYYNELDQPVFICSICLENTEGIGTTTFFTTYDVSEFLFHLQHHFITIYSKSVDEPSTKKGRNFQKGIVNSTATKSSDVHPVKIEKNPIGITDNCTEKLVDNPASSQTKELYQIDIKEEVQDDYWEQPLLDKDDESDDEMSYMKHDEMSKFAFSNSNYYYDDQNFNLSGAEDDEEDNYEAYDNDDFGVDESRDDGRFSKNNDCVEIYDEAESSQDLTSSPKQAKLKNNTHTNAEADDADIYFYKCTVCSLAFGQRIDLLKHMRSHKKEEISSSNKKSQSSNGIPTPEASPCEASTNQRNNLNSNQLKNSQFNDQYDNDLKADQSQHHFSSRQRKHSRPFRSFQCKICGKRTATEHTMQIHQRRFHSAILEKDSIANQYTFEYFHQVPQPEQYIRQRTSDRGVKGQLLTRPFQCKICNKRTGTQQAMKLHQQRFHSSATHLITTQCEICHKRIFTPKLQQHMIVHRAAQYKCDYCGLIYKHKQSLTIHIKKFHPHS